jgi:hypothetical protein
MTDQHAHSPLEMMSSSVAIFALMFASHTR